MQPARQDKGLPDILFRDSRFIILDKPAGLPVHAGPSGAASVEDLFPRLSLRRSGPWLAHRLDADTSGCLVIALTRVALHAAQAEFAAGRVRKIYWAVVDGVPPGDHGTIAAPVIKRSSKSGWRMAVDPAGQPAVTTWRLLGTAGGRSLLELAPRTGRTHQVRIHCAHLGCAVLGDRIYGATPAPDLRLHLLARSIDLALDPPVGAVAAPPAHMRRTLAAMEVKPDDSLSRPGQCPSQA
jgi:RluA family pseudouridine synthase